jgi:hypothetical protein
MHHRATGRWLQARRPDIRYRGILKGHGPKPTLIGFHESVDCCLRPTVLAAVKSRQDLTVGTDDNADLLGRRLTYCILGLIVALSNPSSGSQSIWSLKLRPLCNCGLPVSLQTGMRQDMRGGILSGFVPASVASDAQEP